MNQRFEAGQFITFTYNPPAKPVKRAYREQPPKVVIGPDGVKRSVPQPAVRPEPVEAPHDPNKEILVLHPNWNNKVHGIDLKRITPAEQQVLRSIMDPKVKAQIDGGTWPAEGAPAYPLIRDILSRMDPAELIKNPLAFYQRLVKPFIRNKDCYRQFWPNYMYGVKVIQESHVQGSLINPKPLFRKI